jgi:hypothetical protein
MEMIGMGRTPYTLPLISTLLLLFAGLFLATSIAEAQTRRDIAVLVGQVRAGGAGEVAALLPTLKKSHPDKAGVLFLEAMLESNAERAVALYQRVADEHGDSEWADDALYRLYQYSYAVGAYRTARRYAERLEKEHPASLWLGRESGSITEDIGHRAAQGNSARAHNASTPAADAPESVAKQQPDQKQQSASAAGSDAGQQYSVQVGAWSREADAVKQAETLKKRGYTAYVREKTVQGKRVHAVWLGIFPDITQARDFANRIKEQQNIDAIVVRR